MVREFEAILYVVSIGTSHQACPGSKKVLAPPLPEPEIHALMQGMALAKQHSEGLIIVQSDSSTSLASLKGDNLDRSAYVI